MGNIPSCQCNKCILSKIIILTKLITIKDLEIMENWKYQKITTIIK